jgi:solute:Na+ symporter, SSS family
MNALPAWLAAFVVVSMISGMSSAANGTAAAAGTFYVRHIHPLMTGVFPKRPVVTARWALLWGFVVSTVLALYTGNIVDFVVKFLPLTMSGLAVIIVLGRFWKRSTWQGALAALITTPLVSLIVMRFWDNPTLPATLAGLVAQIVVSLLTPPNQRSFAEVAAQMTRERQGVEGISAHADTAPAIP